MSNKKMSAEERVRAVAVESIHRCKPWRAVPEDNAIRIAKEYEAETEALRAEVERLRRIVYCARRTFGVERHRSCAPAPTAPRTAREGLST